MADETPLFGLDKELKEKADAKFDPARAAEAQHWIETVTSERFVSSDFEESLKDGVLLCKLMNIIYPGLRPPLFVDINHNTHTRILLTQLDANIKPNASKMPFKQMENINNFLHAATRLGVPLHDQFQTIDLHQGKNIPQVVQCMYSVSRTASAKGYAGPLLGPKLSTSNSREFSQDVMNQSKKVIGLQMGLSKDQGANASGMSFGAKRDIGGGRS
ncbi:hypothetical protein SmJEL517_g06148 [Synchytrium microbalum]|uniref:Calponin-homology (CH) domain-containing protein n=1 Tax=Synchytrium microbalum TaxID=1806994 RepID=A0A507BY93_9FUNG|nr:uncharacterized protein SmJEL517_g06148 [Synchytrium microbalum]TPX30243.1 hypothetical protein SmJEL517_g06148 [Synchytrium microbalum]